MSKDENFRYELQGLINKHSRENESSTPDFILADVMLDALRSFERTVKRRDLHGYGASPGDER